VGEKYTIFVSRKKSRRCLLGRPCVVKPPRIFGNKIKNLRKAQESVWINQQNNTTSRVTVVTLVATIAFHS
jgi:hypothetical protein